MSGPDLHVHSTASDGVLTPSEIVSLAIRSDCPAIALTDHDSVDGVAEALAAADGTALIVIPAVELSAGIGDRGVHVLGYWIDHTDPTLLQRLEHLRRIRVERATIIVQALSAGGFPVTIEDVLAAADGGAVGRAHIAQLLVATGYVDSVQEAFERLLGSSAPYYVAKPVYPPAEVISWITDAGGVAVLAHPGLSEVDDLIPGLVADGIVGLEAYHPAHDRDAALTYSGMAASLQMIVTGGSDFHGLGRERDRLGSEDVPEIVLPQLLAARERAGRSS
ncbi:MAG: PHP domain-containing protein [Actinobacteria bacterium]|nr:PHP domain-containing protein [Actinomycetota bacterium]